MDRTRLLRNGIFAAGFLAGVAAGWPAPPAADVRHAATASAGTSTGCGVPPPPAPPAAIRVGGRDRAAIVAVPATYRPDRPLPLVVAFHGRTSPAERVRRYYGLEDQGLEAIFVYPSALPAADGRFSWQDPGDRPGALRDFALFDGIVETLGRSYCIDPGRVFVVGHSLGASFANSLGCARGDAIRASRRSPGGSPPRGAGAARPSC